MLIIRRFPRRQSLCALLLCLLLTEAARAAEPKLNVIILDICSARADHFGFNGYKRGTTPEIDKLAKKSVVFDQAWAQSSWCLPNYATLFTGHIPEVHGQYTNLPFQDLPSFETTLAQKMKESGYRTGGFTGGVYFLPAWGLDRGFDRFTNRFSTTTALPAEFSSYSSDVLDWIGKDSRKPFFVYATVDDLHSPYQSDDPETFDPGYEGVAHSTDVLSVRFFRAYNGEPLDEGSPLQGTLERFRQDKRAVEHVAAHYDAALKQADGSIAAFVRRLKQLGLWDKTVVIITGDHGELLGEHGLLGHTEGIYEPILRVPLLVHFPGREDLAGRRLHDLVERVDLMPTVLDIGKAPTRGLELQGKSLLPLLEGSAPRLREYAFASSKRNMARVTDRALDERAVRDERWKLHWYLHKDRFELYDLQNDPGETEDLSSKKPDVVARLSFELLKNAELSRPHAPGLPSGRQPSAPLVAPSPAD